MWELVRLSHATCHTLCRSLRHAEHHCSSWVRKKCDRFSYFHIPHVTLLHVIRHKSYVKCSCGSLGHAEQLLFSCVGSKAMVFHAITCHISHVKYLCWSLRQAQQLLFSCGSWNWLLSCCCMSHATCLCWSLGHAKQLLFLCARKKLLFLILSHAICHVSCVKFLCWSWRHAKQLLFSCVSLCWSLEHV